MENIMALEKLAVKNEKINIAGLKREDFATPELRAKYFRHNNKWLDRMHMPEPSPEQYADMASQLFSKQNNSATVFSIYTASDHYMKKVKIAILAKDLGVSVKQLYTYDYMWNEDYYIHSNFLVNMDIAEDLFREREVDYRELTAWNVYIDRDAVKHSVPEDLWNSLYNFCYTAITIRKAMILHKVQQCLSFLMSMLESTEGFSINTTSAQIATLQSYMSFFTELLKDSNYKEFLLAHTDVDVFANCESTAKDYVETYRTMLRQLIRGTGSDLEFFRQDMSKVEDPCLDLILAEDLDPEDCLSGSYISNEDDGEFEAFTEE